jgi:hypothetical protein
MKYLVIFIIILIILINIIFIKDIFMKRHIFNKNLNKNDINKFEDGTYIRYNKCLYDCNNNYYCDYLTCRNTCENKFLL